MKRRAAVAMLAMFAAILVIPALPAAAQPGQGPGGGHRGMDRPPPDRQMPPPDRQWKGGGGAEHRHGMSPEERRQLRRDISDHGRDIYRDPRDGRRRQP